MPVLVTVAEPTLGAALLGRLAGLGGEVRAFCAEEAPVAAFRQLGVICASGSLLDEGHLETAMEQVHTVVHVVAGPLHHDTAQIVEETATVVSAAIGAQVRRILALSVAGAGEARDPLRQAAGEAEQLVREAPCQSVVVRLSLLDTPELRHALARTPLPREALAIPVAPLRPEDVAALIAWFDDRRDLAGGLFAADGATAEPLRDYLRRVEVTPLSLPGTGHALKRRAGWMAGRLRSSLPAPLLAESLSAPWTSGASVPDAWAVSGIRPLTVGS